MCITYRGHVYTVTTVAEMAALLSDVSFIEELERIKNPPRIVGSFTKAS